MICTSEQYVPLTHKNYSSTVPEHDPAEDKRVNLGKRDTNNEFHLEKIVELQDLSRGSFYGLHK